MRWSAVNRGTVCIQKNSFLKNKTIGELKAMLIANQALCKQIMFYGGKLRVTRAYWFQRAGDLLDMVSQLEAPNILLTSSAAGKSEKFSECFF